MFDLEQKRAKHALSLIEKLKDRSKAEQKLILGLPALIQKNGLAMTGLYLCHKKFDTLADGLMAHLKGSGQAKEYFIQMVSENRVLDLQAKTVEAKLFAGWVKRLGRINLKELEDESSDAFVE